MRTRKNFNDSWRFIRSDCGPHVAWEQGFPTSLPHTWNAQDGQDGGNDYYRGKCWYAKKFPPPESGEGEEIWLEFEGAAMSAQVWLNGKKLADHSGGYSTFRVNLTGHLLPENTLAVLVDNSANYTVYPQKADFTFYGGLYRDVNLLIVPTAHFALDHYGGCGVKVTPLLSQDLHTAQLILEAQVTGKVDYVHFSVDGKQCESPVENGCANGEILLENVHLWNGVEDPHLYTLSAKLSSGDEVLVNFGCRTICFDSETGFYLNGKNLRLCGVARHQDRQGLGNALTCTEHEEDMALIRELGANTVRLAHYQHSQYFYDLCDKYGMVVWAEIPYITEHMERGTENTLNQMKELIVQNYNNPSIICWGLSNEITAHGGATPAIWENHRRLNDLCHKLDSTRPTTMAHAFMLDPDDPFALLPDICSYNLYYGWYLGELEQNDEWFDAFHANHPNTVIGLSEYGADANPTYQNGHPERGDWSEAYQAVYHEHLLKMWQKRPYIWAMHCWNMFDFAADGREEGGKPGQNQKGLVTFDRKIKKDAFYLYKAYLSSEAFVHLCSKRYVQRAGETTEIKVYSNQSAVTLSVDGKEIETKTGDKVFRFNVLLNGQHHIAVNAGTLHDEMTIFRVDVEPAEYHHGDSGRSEIVNWFDKPEEMMREGYYSIFDTMEEMKQNPQAAELLADIMTQVHNSYGEVAKSVILPESTQRMLDRMPFYKIAKQAGKALTPAMIKEFNAKLNMIARNQNIL